MGVEARNVTPSPQAILEKSARPRARTHTGKKKREDKRAQPYHVQGLESSSSL